MKTNGITLSVLAFLVTGCAAPTLNTAGERTEDGLYPIENTMVDQAWARPDIDLSPYSKIRLEGAGIEYREVSASAGRSSGFSSSGEDEFPMDEEARERFRAIVVEAFVTELSRLERYELTAETGPDVLVVKGRLLDVAINRPLRRNYTYVAPPDVADQLELGSRVAIQFAGKREVAVIVGLPESTDVPGSKLRRISAVLDAEPVIDPGDGGEYAVDIDPADFVETIDNPYLPLLPGARWVYEGIEDGETERVEVEVTEERRDVMGISAVVVRDVVYEDGELVEDTYDWFAQDVDGNVWYFGEDSKEYEDGEVVSTERSWEAGVDGALPGIVMLADPVVGEAYRQDAETGAQHGQPGFSVIRLLGWIRRVDLDSA